MKEKQNYRITMNKNREKRNVRGNNGTSYVSYFKNFCFEKFKRYGISGCLSMILLLSLLLFSSKNVQAASGSVYTCKMNPSYSHPVTGQVEDVGGSSSSTTGQGMVEGAIGSKGILEVTDSGEYYLTFQLGLMDYSSKQSFSVQNINDSGWNTVSAIVTGNGSDSSGKTADMRIQIPSESCIVRCSMYVEPMGRNVIFYFYPSDYSAGNSTNMKEGIVTQNSASSGTADTQGSNAAANTNPSESDGSSSIGIVEIILAVCAGVTISGLILLFTGAYIVYIFRKNWKRWGAGKLYLTPEEQDYKEESVYMADGFGEPDTENDVWDSEGVVHEEPEEKESEKNIWDYEEESSFVKEYDEIGNNAELEGERKDEN